MTLPAPKKHSTFEDTIVQNDRHQTLQYNETKRRLPIWIIDDVEYILLEDIHNAISTRITALIRSNNDAITCERDSKGIELDPPRFKAYPDELLDCYVSDIDVTTNCKTQEKLDLIIDNQGKILSRLDVILRQAYQLAEFTVPRFFIVMIEKKSLLHPDNLLYSTYRLFFLCECNKDEMHLAYHEGYIINQPREFFIKYGPYVKNMIYAFKAFGTVAGFILPNFAFAQQIPIPNILKDGKFWKDFADKMNTVDNVVNNVMAKTTNITLNPTSCQAYEGADLRQLEKFLKKTDDGQTLGNLYRTTTDEGHVRWVCIKHFNENYSKTRMEEF
ncbi:unnamed protein product, partial [Didymodactylos carnosus]